MHSRLSHVHAAFAALALPGLLAANRPPKTSRRRSTPCSRRSNPRGQTESAPPTSMPPSAGCWTMRIAAASSWPSRASPPAMTRASSSSAAAMATSASAPPPSSRSAMSAATGMIPRPQGATATMMALRSAGPSSVSPAMSFSPDLTYKFQWGTSRNAGGTNASVSLEDAWARYKLAPNWTVFAGQFEDPISHEAWSGRGSRRCRRSRTWPGGSRSHHRSCSLWECRCLRGSCRRSGPGAGRGG